MYTKNMLLLLLKIKSKFTLGLYIHIYVLSTHSESPTDSKISPSLLVFVDAGPIHKALIIFFVLNGLDVRFSKHCVPFCYILFWSFSPFAIFQAPMSIKLPLFVIGNFRFSFPRPLYLGVCVGSIFHPHTLFTVSKTISIRTWVRVGIFFLKQHQPKNRFVLNHMLWLRFTTCLVCSVVSHSCLLQCWINLWSLAFCAAVATKHL